MANFIKLSQGFIITEVDLLNQIVDQIDFSGISSVLHLAALVHHMKEEHYFRINRDLTFEVAKRS